MDNIKSEKNPPNPPKEKRFGLSEQVMVGLVLGIATGLFLGEMAGPLETVGIIFIRLLQITVIPYISLSLITGIGGLSIAELKMLTIKGGVILMGVYAMMLFMILCLPLAFPYWPSSSFFSASLIKEPQTIDFINMFIPSNPVTAFADSSIPAVVLFSVLVGIGLIGTSEKLKIIEPLSVLQTVMMKITGFVSKLSPIGVFAMIASTAGTADLGDLARIQVYIVLYVLTALVFSLLVLPGLITVMTPFTYKNILRELRAPMITAFATGSSLIVVPQIIEQSKKIIDTANFHSVYEEESDTSLEVLIPMVYSFPSIAGLLALSFILFSAWYIGSDIPVTSYPTLFAAGIPSLFGGTTITIPFLLSLMNLPVDFFKIFVSVDVITVRFGTFMSSMQYATIGIIGTLAIYGKLRLRWIRLARLVCMTAALIIPLLIGVNAIYTYALVVPYTKDQALQNMTLLNPPQDHVVHTKVPLAFLEGKGRPASLAEIETRGELRVCYQPEEYPSSFYSFNDRSQLIGFDIEMAHQFARQMRLSIQFIPAETEIEAKGYLEKGVCDIYMRTMPISVERTKQFNMSVPAYNSTLGLIVKDADREKFQQWEQVLKMGDQFRVAFELKPENKYWIRQVFPEATLLPYSTVTELKQILESGGDEINAIVNMAEEGAAWTLLYPKFSLVVPKPVEAFPVGYAVAIGNDDLSRVLDAWLQSIKTQGGVDKLYRHWMLGEGLNVNKPPRWSIIRNVLGWVE
jgi:Na+/H+-dicarboxylate symporter/ABC-type amino acid transport substrate-binding protein